MGWVWGERGGAGGGVAGKRRKERGEESSGGGEAGNGEVRGVRPKSASDELVACDLDLALPSRPSPSFAVPSTARAN